MVEGSLAITRPAQNPSKNFLRDFQGPGLYWVSTPLMSPSPTPDPLSRTLADWRVTPTRDPRFRTRVWSRIGAAAREPWGDYVRSHLASWSAAALVAMAFAGWAGRTAAETRLKGEREAMVVAYLVDLDPRVQAKLRQ